MQAKAIRAGITRASWGGIMLLAASVLVMQGTSPTLAAEPEPTVVIGYENLGATPEMVVITNGWFQKYMHAHVVLKEFDSGPAALTAIASGALQFMTEIGNPPVASALSKGVPLDVIWNDETFTDGEGLVARNQSHIAGLADLKGKRVAVVSGSSSDYVLSEALKRAGVNRADIDLINMGPPSMLSAWQAGSIDAAFVWTPVLNKLAENDGKIVFTDAQASAYAPSVNVSVVDTGWAKAHPGLVVAFLRAQNAGVEYTRSHTAEALKVMAKGAGISESLARVELSGIEYYDARQQLTDKALGSPGHPAPSAVGKGLDGTLSFLQEAGLASGSGGPKPSSRIVTTYVRALLRKP